MDNNNGAIGWDDEVSLSELDGENGNDDFVILPEGRYSFTVNKVERGTWKGSEKLSACNMVKVGVIVDGGEHGRSYVTTRFFMHRKMIFKINQFMLSIGIYKKGEEPGTIPWSKVAKGQTGECHVTIHEYKGEKSNEVDKWLMPKEDTPTPPSEY